MKKLLSLILPLLCLSACVLENDEAFLPSTQRGFLLLEDQENGQKSICEILDSSLSKNIHQSPEWDIEEPIIDIAGWEGWLYVLTEEAIIYRIDLSGNSSKWRIQIPDTRPSSITAGERSLLLGDSLNKQLIFVEDKGNNWEWTAIPVERRPGKALYRSSKFFVPMDSIWLESWHETGFSKLSEVEIGRPIVDIQANNRIEVQTLCREEAQWFLGGIDWNNSNWTSPLVETPVRLFRTTPYFRSSYEKEWLRDIRVDSSRRLFFTNNIRALEVDFFESNVFLQHNDTLRKVNARSLDLIDLGIMREKILGSYFYVGR